MFLALDSCKDGVIITGPKHDIQYANNSIEKTLGFRLEEIIGQKTQEYFQTDMNKSDVDEKINNYNKGKVKKTNLLNPFITTTRKACL